MNRAPDVTGEMIYELTVKLASRHHQMFVEAMEDQRKLIGSKALGTEEIQGVITALHAVQVKDFEEWLEQYHLHVMRTPDDLEEHFLPSLITSG